MLLLSVAALAGKAPDPLSEPVWIERGPLEPRVCVSMVPDAGRFKRRDALGWAVVREQLAAGDVEDAAQTARQLKDHPARRAILGAAYVLGVGIAIDLEPLVQRYSDDACLRLLAATAALRSGDATSMSRHLDAAQALWPTNEDVNAMAVLVDSGDWPARARGAIEARPDDVRLLQTVARVAEERGEAAIAIAAYQRVLAHGHSEVRDRTARLALHSGDVDTYLALADEDHPVTAGGALAQDDPGEAVRAWLGIPSWDSPLPAVIETSMGELRCTLDVANAPLTVLNFVGLARGEQPWTSDGATVTRPLYDGTVFHRVLPDFMIQGGDPLGNGMGGPGYRFDDEPSPRGAFDRPALLAMANSGPDTNGSQFFVTEVPTRHLDGKHTIFGQCDADAHALVKRIARVAANGDGRPDEEVVIRRIRVGD